MGVRREGRIGNPVRRGVRRPGRPPIVSDELDGCVADPCRCRSSRALCDLLEPPGARPSGSPGLAVGGVCSELRVRVHSLVVLAMPPRSLKRTGGRRGQTRRGGRSDTPTLLTGRPAAAATAPCSACAPSACVYSDQDELRVELWRSAAAAMSPVVRSRWRCGSCGTQQLKLRRDDRFNRDDATTEQHHTSAQAYSADDGRGAAVRAELRCEGRAVAERGNSWAAAWLRALRSSTKCKQSKASKRSTRRGRVRHRSMRRRRFYLIA